MDQDFHYYGAYYAARVGGKYSREDASTIAKASNFIDFLSNEEYAGYWHVVRDEKKPEGGDYDIVAKVDYPRYSFQSTASCALGESGGLWASFHFTPGNYRDPENTPTAVDVHGKMVAGELPGHQLREVKLDSSLKIDAKIAKLLNRPQSALSRALIQDTVQCLRDSKHLEAILKLAAGGKELLEEQDKADIIKRFGLMLLGIRAHVIADTWAHQDWSAANNAVNTYWDIAGDSFKDDFYQRIEYQDVGSEWTREHLSGVSSWITSWVTKDENLEAAPNYTSYLGHGWMGHLPDYSFAKYRYKPCWLKKEAPPLERDNPMEYKHAFLELCSLFSLTKGNEFQLADARDELTAAEEAFSSPCQIANKKNNPRVHSAQQWITKMSSLNIEEPVDCINVAEEPDSKAVLDGKVGTKSGYKTNLGTYYINYASDLYLFEIAVDYQFHFVKNWLHKNGIGTDLFKDNWSKKFGPLSEKIGEFLG